MFRRVEQEIDGPALRLRYHRAPWDDDTVGGPVVVISELEVRDISTAIAAFDAFRSFYSEHGALLVSCRLAHERLLECGFLESQGFRFIELNYRPECHGLQSMPLESSVRFDVRPATLPDEDEIADMAGQIFQAGRFHNDPMIDPRIGNLRYRNWVHNAFRNPKQSVLKCVEGGRTVAFFVVESPAPDRRFWSLVGLAPGLGGHGLGAEVWRAVLRHHRDEGVDSVATSISSLNVRVQNLYVKLGFRFPAPEITLHLCPLGPVGASGRVAL